MNVLGRWREYFQDLSTLVTITLPDAQEIHFRKESTLNAAEILLGVKILKEGKAALKFGQK